VADLLWHVAGWMHTCADHLEAMRERRFQDEELSAERIDEFNATLVAQARAMTTDEVWDGLVEARELLLQRLGELAVVDDAVVEELAAETYEHYEEHLPDLERFAG
jgi:hypothetical protein